MREWLPDDNLLWLVVDAIEQSDLAAFRPAYRADGQGRPAFDPALLMALLLYCYCQGVRSSRELGRRCVRGLPGDHRDTARTMPRSSGSGPRHEAALDTLFTEVLRLCAQAGMMT
jgi:hypothetical protein